MVYRVNAQYNVTQPESLPARVAGHARRRMYDAFLKEKVICGGEDILDVGVTSDQTYESSNYLPRWFPDKVSITAVGIDDASFLESVCPGLTFLYADGCQLPFASKSFDIVHSSAVIEHVGSRLRQKEFVNELCRVARKIVFITTPNRWFPIEFHTLMPLLHWLPPGMFRWLLHKVGHVVLDKEENLNLLSGSDLLKMCRDVPGYSFQLKYHRLLGWPSNLVLVGHRLDRGVSDPSV